MFLFLLLMGPDSGRALYLDGVDGYASTTGVSLSPTDDWTVSFEFLYLGNGIILDTQASTAGKGFQIYLNSGNLAIRINGGSGNQVQTLTDLDLELGRHYYVSLLYDYDTSLGTADMSWVINGMTYTGLSAVSYLPDTTGRVYVGRLDHAAGQFCEMILENLMFVQELYSDQPRSGPSPSVAPLFFCQFNDPANASTLLDSGTASANLTPSGGCFTTPTDGIDLNLGFARFNGISSYASSSGFSLNEDGFTLEFDFRFERNPDQIGPATLLDFMETTGLSIKLNPESGNLILAMAGLSQSDEWTLPPALAPNTWHRFSLTYTDTVKKGGGDYQVIVFINDSFELLEFADFSNPIDDLIIGASNDSGSLDQFFRGDLDLLRSLATDVYVGNPYTFFPLSLFPDDTESMWLFDPSTNLPSSWIDSGSNALNLSSNDITGATTNDPPWVTTWADFDGYGDVYVSPLFGFDPAGWSLEFFARHQSFTAGTAFDMPTSAGGVQISCDSTGILSLIVNGSTFMLDNIAGADWVHVLVVYSESAGEFNAFINGIPKGGMMNPVWDPADLPDFFAIGNDMSSTNPFPGEISQVRISDFRRHISDFSPPLFETPTDSRTLALWNFSDGALGVSQYTDQTGNGHPLYLCSSPSINEHPQDQDVCLGDGFTLSVDVGDSWNTYQWYKDANPIDGQRSADLIVPSASSEDFGTYFCIVTSGCGSLMSDPADVVVREPVSFASQPESQEACVGDEVSFAVELVLELRGGVFFQWQLDGVDLPGETNEELTILSVDITDAGTYRCLVDKGDGCPPTPSNEALLSVSNTTVDAGLSKIVCNPGDSVLLLGSLDCNPSGTVLWTGDGSIADATSLEPTVTPPSTPGSYLYTMTFSPSGGGSATADDVLVQVVDISVAFANGTISSADLADLIDAWPNENAIEFDFGPPPAGDGLFNILDLVLLPGCDGYIP